MGRDGKSACAAAVATPQPSQSQASQKTDSKARALFMAAIPPKSRLVRSADQARAGIAVVCRSIWHRGARFKRKSASRVGTGGQALSGCSAPTRCHTRARNRNKRDATRSEMETS
jgi:hypothetical protein